MRRLYAETQNQKGSRNPHLKVNQYVPSFFSCNLPQKSKPVELNPFPSFPQIESLRPTRSLTRAFLPSPKFLLLLQQGELLDFIKTTNFRIEIDIIIDHHSIRRLPISNPLLSSGQFPGGTPSQYIIENSEL